MKKSIYLVSTLAIIISLSFITVVPCLAEELSSKQIKRIEEGIEKIKDQARGIQRNGYRELKKIGPTAAPYLAETLKDKTVNRESRALICDLLGELKAKEAVTVLIYTLKNESYTVRASASRALGRIADPAAIKPLLGMLDDEEYEVREAATYALMSFDDDRIPPRVERLLKDDEGPVRFAAISLLNDKLDPRTARGIRQAVREDKLADVRQIAARALGGLKDKEAVDILMESITEDVDDSVREECAVSLGKIGDEKAIPALIEALKDEYKDVQLRASYSLKDLTGKFFGRDYEEWSEWYEEQ